MRKGQSAKSLFLAQDGISAWWMTNCMWGWKLNIDLLWWCGYRRSFTDSLVNFLSVEAVLIAGLTFFSICIDRWVNLLNVDVSPLVWFTKSMERTERAPEWNGSGHWHAGYVPPTLITFSMYHLLWLCSVWIIYSDHFQYEPPTLAHFSMYHLPWLLSVCTTYPDYFQYVPPTMIMFIMNHLLWSISVW